jgi:hypothetical protein
LIESLSLAREETDMAYDAEGRLKALESAPVDSWIALSEDESHILATGKTFQEVSDKLDGVDEPGIISKTPPAWGMLIL